MENEYNYNYDIDYCSMPTLIHYHSGGTQFFLCSMMEEQPVQASDIAQNTGRDPVLCKVRELTLSE